MNIVANLRRLRAISSATAVELCGQPAVLLIAIAGMAAAALVPFFQFHSFGEPGRLSRDGCLAYQMVIGIIMAAVGASATIHDEMSGGTMASALSKPVARDLFLAGKWLGAMRVIARFWFCMLAATLVAERIPERMENFEFVTDKTAQFGLFLVPILSLVVAGYRHNRRGARFCKGALDAMTILSAVLLVFAFLFNRMCAFAPSPANINLNTIPVSLLILMALGVYAAVAAALSTRVGAAASLAICLLLVLLGLSASALRALPLGFLAFAIPDLQVFWMCDAIASGGSLPARHLLAAAAYAASLTVAAMGLGMWSFRSKDIS